MKKLKKSERRVLKFTVYKRIAVSFIIFTTALLALIIYFSIGKAVISIEPAAVRTEVEILIPIQPDINPRPGEPILAGDMQSMIIEGSEIARAAEYTEVPAKAQGIVTIINDSGQDQPLVATTRLLSPNNILFRIKRGVAVPAHGQVQVEAQADKEGKEGNIEPTTFTIPGLSQVRQKEVYAKTDSPITGGTISALTLTPENIQKTKEKLDETIRTAFFEEINSEEEGIIYHESTLKLETMEESEEDASSAMTDEEQWAGKIFRKKARASAARYNEQKLFDLLRERIGRSLPQNHKLYQLDYSKLKIEIIEHNEDGTGLLKASIAAWTVLDSENQILDPEKFISLPPDKIRSTLEGLPGIEKVKIRLFPIWTKRTPPFKENIEIRMEEPKLPAV